MEMNYRIIVRLNRTGEAREQYFATVGDADTIADYLELALENGAELGYVIQTRVNGKAVAIQYGGEFIGEWENLSWNA